MLYQCDFFLYETDSDNNITREYIWSESGYPIAFKYQDNMYYYHTNYRGDILAITDQSGTIVAEYSYDAWGNILSQSGDLAAINPLRYAGCYYDAETKFYYLMNRYYNPEHGVFISLDPEAGDLLDPITQNGYIYADNNPVMIMDKIGTLADTILDIASVGLSSYELYKNPSLKNAAYLAADVVAAALPFVPSATSVKVAAKVISKNKSAKTATQKVVKNNKKLNLDLQFFSKVRLTAKQALQEARKLGFTETNYFSHGQPIFRKGNKYITLDVDAHSGGVWKMADSVKNLGSKKTRMGTYDKYLKRIGD
jgi:RHS repeat-associated protein